MDNQLKYNLIEKLVLTEDESILEQVNELLKGTELTYWDQLNPRLKESIDRGLKESLEGAGENHEDVMRKFRERVKK